MGQDRKTQLANLRKDFPSTSTISESASELVLKVDHNVRISDTTQYSLTLYVSIAPEFPRSAPTAMLPHSCRKVPITPPNVSPSEIAAYAWDPNASTLLEAVRNAFSNAADLWGAVAPPTMQAVAALLSGETDRLLGDIINNPNCLEAYCYQMPIVKNMREAGRSTIDEVERTANENVSLRPEVEQLHASVLELQKQLAQQIEAVQAASRTPLLASVCTPAALSQTLERDVQQLNNECHTLGGQALASFATDKRAFQQLLEQYKAKSRQMHMVDMKRRAFKAQQV